MNVHTQDYRTMETPHCLKFKFLHSYAAALHTVHCQNCDMINRNLHNIELIHQAAENVFEVVEMGKRQDDLITDSRVGSHLSPP